MNSKKYFVLFQTKRTNSYIICSYQQQVILNNCLFIKKMLVFPKNAEKNASIIEKGLGTGPRGKTLYNNDLEQISYLPGPKANANN